MIASVVRYSVAIRSSASPASRRAAVARDQHGAVERAAKLVVAQRVLVLEVALVLAALHLVERRLGDVDVAFSTRAGICR